jgi:hypothetical protein
VGNRAEIPPNIALERGRKRGVVERLMGRLRILPHHLLIRHDGARLRRSIRARLRDLRALTLVAGNEDCRGMSGFGAGGAALAAASMATGNTPSRSGSRASPSGSSTLALSLTAPLTLSLCLALTLSFCLALSLTFLLSLPLATGGGATSATLTRLRTLAGTWLVALSRGGCPLAGFPLCGRLSSRRDAVLSIRALWSTGGGLSVWGTSGNGAIDA